VRRDGGEGQGPAVFAFGYAEHSGPAGLARFEDGVVGWRRAKGERASLQHVSNTSR
jgi:hypothetical protein